MAGDLAGARTLAGLFAAASRPPGAQRDAYFDPEGEELLAILLLAARLPPALDRRLSVAGNGTQRGDRRGSWSNRATSWPPRPSPTS